MQKISGPWGVHLHAGRTARIESTGAGVQMGRTWTGDLITVRSLCEGDVSTERAERVGDYRSMNSTTPNKDPDDAAAKAEQQKKDARAPRRAVKTSPKAKPPETGKPIWAKPHSS